MAESVFIDNELSRHNLSIVELNALRPDANQYSILFIQPHEDVATQPAGDGATPSQFVRNKNFKSAYLKYINFLELARLENIDLVLSPEYSCPWQVIEESIQHYQIPNDGKLWVLGCESITPSELDRLAVQYGDVIWIYEKNIQEANSKFLNPICYIFQASDAQCNRKPVIVVQFKNQPMSDHLHFFERDNLIKGTKRYILRNDDDSIYLVTLICSDALDFTIESLPQNKHLPYLILHPQLNLDPRHLAFKQYRQEAFLKGRERQEFICVNWARGFKLSDGNPSQFGGSAFYTKSDKLILADNRVNANHQKGLYYTKCETHRTHIYFFNYAEHLFYLRTTKPSQALAMGVLQHSRTGPEMLKVYNWNSNEQKWFEGCQPDDGFRKLCDEIGNDVTPLLDEGMSPINKERLLALSNGIVKASHGRNWFDADQLKLFKIKDDEIVHRMTVVQDPCEEAYEERFRYLQNYSDLKNQIITNPCNFPECIRDFAGNCTIQYPIGKNGYNYNLCRNDGTGKATVVFLGTCLRLKPDLVYDTLASILQDDQRRLVVWYKQNENICIKYRDQKPEINEDLSEDGRSIAKER